MWWKTKAFAVAAAVFVVGAIAATSALALTPPDPNQVVAKVLICHRTNANTNPYVINEPNANGDVSGHAGHVGSDNPGPVWNPTLKAQGIKWGDIIPPFKWSGGNFPGLNWTAEGQALYANDCKPLTPVVQVFGTLAVTKVVSVPANPVSGIPTSFTVHVECDDEATSVNVSFPANGGAGTPPVIANIEAGSTCTLSELGTGSFPPGSSFVFTPSNVVVVHGNENVMVTLTNTFPSANPLPVNVAAAQAVAPRAVASSPRFTG